MLILVDVYFGKVVVFWVGGIFVLYGMICVNLEVIDVLVQQYVVCYIVFFGDFLYVCVGCVVGMFVVLV